MQSLHKEQLVIYTTKAKTPEESVGTRPSGVALMESTFAAQSLSLKRLLSQSYIRREPVPATILFTMLRSTFVIYTTPFTQKHWGRTTTTIFYSERGNLSKACKKFFS